MKKLNVVLPAIALASGLALASNAQAQVSATATTTVDVNFPEILVLYTYTDITLNLDETFLTNQTDLTTSATSCGTSGNCQDQGSATAVTVDAATEDVNIGSTITGLSDTTVDFTLSNAFAARSIGLSNANYDVTISEVGNSTVVNLGSGGASFTINNSGLTFSNGDLPITLDLNALSATSSSESEDFEITVSGT